MVKSMKKEMNEAFYHRQNFRICKALQNNGAGMELNAIGPMIGLAA